MVQQRAEAADDRKAETQPLATIAFLVSHLIELVEDPWKLGSRTAGAGLQHSAPPPRAPPRRARAPGHAPASRQVCVRLRCSALRWPRDCSECAAAAPDPYTPP